MEAGLHGRPPDNEFAEKGAKEKKTNPPQPKRRWGKLLQLEGALVGGGGGGGGGL